LAGLENLLPLTEIQLKIVPWDAPVTHDLRGRWNDSHQAYEWSIKNLLPRCDRTIAHSAGHTYDGVDIGHDPAVIAALDYSVSRKAFVYNLSPAAKTDKYPDGPVPGYPKDVKVYRKILQRLEAPAAVYGWAEPEWTWASLLSRYNHYAMCGSTTNLSFHAALCPVKKVRCYRQSKRPAGVKLEDKTYIAFMVSEGDAPRVAGSFFGGAWESRIAVQSLSTGA